MLLAISLKLSS
jgi:hypothetical protein